MLSVVVMAFNEVETLASVVSETRESLDRTGEPHEILIVDDGSLDGTGQLSDRLAREIPGVRVIHHGTNRGLGGVYRTGFAESRGDYLTFFPADGQFPARIIEEFLPLMSESDMVLGYLREGRSSAWARFLSACERILYALLFGRLPRFQGILMFRRRLLEEIPLRSEGRGWAVLIELIIRASNGGYRLTSVPTEIRPRRSGTTKVQNFRTICSNLRQTVALRREL